MSEKTTLSLVSEFSKSKYISFNLNNDSYCIELSYIKEVLKDTIITDIPGTPDFIEGIINLRGDYITVLNLKKFLSIPSEEIQEHKPVIIVRCNELELAFLIDKINELFEITEDKIIGSSEGYFLSEFILNETPYTILNVEKVFTDKRIIITDM
jgi:purine-binding chemotaxis protein CheW